MHPSKKPSTAGTSRLNLLVRCLLLVPVLLLTSLFSHTVTLRCFPSLPDEVLLIAKLLLQLLMLLPVLFYLMLRPVILDTSRRARVEEASRISQQRLALLVEQTPLAVIEWDTDFRVQGWNPAAEQIFGYSREEALGQHASFIVPESTREHVDRIWQALLEQHGGNRSTNENIRRDGRTIICEWFNTPLITSDGKTIAAASLVMDITERARAEENTMRQSSILDGINRIFREAMSAETEEQLGKACLAVAEEITGSKFGFIGEIKEDGRMDDIAISDPGWEVCRMRHSSGHRSVPTGFRMHGIYGRVLNDGKSLYANEPATHSDSIGLPEGHPPLKAFLGAPLMREGKAVGLIALGNREGGYTGKQLEDIEALTPAMVQALLRRRTEEMLRESESVLHSFFDSPGPMRGIVELMDDDILHITANAAAAAFFGRTQELMRGKLAGEIDSTAEIVEKWISCLEESRCSGQPVSFEYPRQVDGQERWLRALVSYLETGPSGRPRFSYVVEDVTEHKQAQDMLAKQAADLARSNAEWEQFGYVASHDLQEPLRMISSYVQLLGRRYQGRLDPDADDFIAYAVDGANRMQQLINDLLTYSRVSTMAKPLEPTDCEAAFDAAMANLGKVIRENDAIVTRDPLPIVITDSTQFVQLLQNLIGNAVKFRGNEPPRVHVRAEQHDDEWVFYVRDNGIGIAPEFHERIFKVFQRLHAKEEYPGTGIGLAICARIVERHGGRVWVESDVGEGSTFYFTIPVRGEKQQ